MSESKFWRIVSVSFVVALLYVGHGLHSGNEALPSLTNTARAAGVGVAVQQGSVLYTSTQDGRTVFEWRTEPNGKPKYVDIANVQ